MSTWIQHTFEIYSTYIKHIVDKRNEALTSETQLHVIQSYIAGYDIHVDVVSTAMWSMSNICRIYVESVSKTCNEQMKRWPCDASAPTIIFCSHGCDDRPKTINGFNGGAYWRLQQRQGLWKSLHNVIRRRGTYPRGIIQ